MLVCYNKNSVVYFLKGEIEMKAEIKKEVTVTLIMNREESAWLRDVMQNPLGTEHNDEDPKDKEMRKKLWHSLTEANQREGEIE